MHVMIWLISTWAHCVLVHIQYLLLAVWFQCCTCFVIVLCMSALWYDYIFCRLGENALSLIICTYWFLPSFYFFSTWKTLEVLSVDQISCIRVSVWCSICWSVACFRSGGSATPARSRIQTQTGRDIEAPSRWSGGKTHPRSSGSRAYSSWGGGQTNWWRGGGQSQSTGSKLSFFAIASITPHQ